MFVVAIPRAHGDAGGEVGGTAIGEGGGHGASGVGALRLAGEVRFGRGTSDELTTGIDGHLATGDGYLRGSHWLRYRIDVAMRRAEETGKPAELESWVAIDHRFDYEARAALSRRRDLARGRYTGEQVAMEAVMLGDDDPYGGGAFLPFSWEIDLVGREGGGRDTLNRFRASFFRWWNDADRDGDAHVREVIVIDSQLHDRDDQAVANTIIFYAERGRPLRLAGWLADFRLGMVTNDGETTLDGEEFVNERHPMVTGGVADGALRWRSGAFAAGLHYDRAMYLSMDSKLGLEDRVSVTSSWTVERLAIEASLYAARTRLWQDRSPAGQTHWTDGVSVTARTHRAGVHASATLEAGHSFYADPEQTAMSPSPGWRATVNLTRRWGELTRW